MALGSVAYACQSLATLKANPGSVAAAGGSVNVTGRNYSSSAGVTPVVIHLDGRNGTVLASLPAPATGTNAISGSVPIPGGLSGTHTLVATQYTASGDAVSGTPGRASVSITVAARTSADGAGATATPVAAASTDATPAAVTPAAAPSAATPAASAAAASTATAPAATSSAAATSAAPGSTPVAPSAASAAAPTAAVTSAAVTPDAAAAAPAASDTSSVSVGGLLPASSDSSSALPGLTLVAGLALVVLALGAFVKSGRSMLGRGFAPLAG